MQLAARIATAMWTGGERLFLRPISAIADAARRLGEGNSDARTGLRCSEDELGRLAGAIDTMAESLKSTNQVLRANRALRVLTALNHALVHASSEPALLQDMCRSITEAGGYRMAWVGYAEHDAEKSVRVVASWGAGAGFLASLHVSWADTERGRGPSGKAIREGVPCALRYVQTDPRYAPWRDLAARYGYASSIALPLQLGAETIGALNIYAEEPDAFSDEEVALLREGAEDLSFGIASQRSQAGLERAGERIRAASLYARSLLEASLDPLVTISPEGKITDVNKASEDATGVARDELIGTDFADYFTDPDMAREGYKEVLARGVVRDYALTIRHRAGTQCDVLYNACVYRNEAGELQGVFAAARDVTERKRLEKEKEQYFRFFMLSTDAMCIADPFGCFKKVNPALLQMTGFPESELVSKPFLDFVLPEDRQRTSDETRLQVERRASLQFENRYVCKDGSVICLSWNAYFDKSDGVTYATARDITALRRAQEDQRAASLYARSLIEASLDPLVTINPEGKITDVNSASEEATGIVREKLIGSDFADYFTEPERARAGYEQVLAQGIVRDYPLTIRHTCGRTTDVLYNASVYRNEAGALQGVFAAARDVTEKKKAEARIRELNEELEMRVVQRTAELEAANKELEAFAYSVSHDLRAPLRSIDGFSLALLEDYADKVDAEGRDNLQRVRAASQRMAQLIDDILNLSRVTRSPLTREAVDLSALARSVAATLLQEEPDRKVQFVIEDGLVAQGDQRLLGLVLSNLIGNAWKYTSLHAMARIEFGHTEVEGKEAYYVRDDGAGFDMAYVEKLFLPFQRLHAPEEFPGNGIGLALVQRILRRHGGSAWAEGQVEQGATFYFCVD